MVFDQGQQLEGGQSPGSNLPAPVLKAVSLFPAITWTAGLGAAPWPLG